MAKPPAETVRPSSNNSHLAGEYFVAAELYKRGFSVAMTLGNAKAIDLFAEKDLRTINVQVKAISVRKNVGWPIRSKRHVFSKIMYVFVCLNGPDRPPTFFIASGREVRPRVHEYSTRAVINYGELNSPQFLGRWDKIEAAFAMRRNHLRG
jgi:hypothetical protein